MRRLLAILGLVILPITAAAQNMEGKSLYEYIHKVTESSLFTKPVELQLERFTAGVYFDHDEEGMEEEVTEKMVDHAINSRVYDICKSSDSERSVCISVMDKLSNLANKFAWQLQLGRDLQMIASGYETGISDYPGHAVSIVSKLSSISRIWKTSNEKYVTPFVETSVAGLPYPEETREDVETKLKEVVQMVKELEITSGEKKDLHQQVAAVWRYQNGVLYVQNHEGQCTGNPETNIDELTILKKRWCDIEQKLLDVRGLILAPYAERGDLSAEEYVLFPSWKDTESNIFVWIREDDIGLEWYLPLEPVQPLMYTDEYTECVKDRGPEECAVSYPTEIIRGGTYPPEVPEPAETDGICSHPFSKQGYLCRAMRDEECAADPVLPSITDPDTPTNRQLRTASGIVLTKCEPEQYKGPVSITPSGPDICEIGGWKRSSGQIGTDTPEVDEDLRPNSCSSCAVDLHCEERCVNNLGGFTEKRNADGVIKICLSKQIEESGLLTYLLNHEMVHAQQFCSLSEEDHQKIDSSVQNCCAVEREAYMATCNDFAEDGILQKVPGNINIDTCASVLANGSCLRFAGNGTMPCSTNNLAGYVNPATFVDDLATAARALSGVVALQTSCEDIVTNINPKAKLARESLPLSCNPGCISEYENTIGNNLCFAGQCLEQSHEWHRLIPGRMTVGSTDEAYPWDACAIEDPQYGRFYTPPALGVTNFPPYNPQRLYEELDQALCQINGLPAKTPPVLCAFDARRRINAPLNDYISMGQSLAEQNLEYIVPAQGLLGIAPGVASRMADGIFLRYMKTAAQSFADIFEVASDVVGSIGETKFPSAMCPRQGEKISCDEFAQ